MAEQSLSERVNGLVKECLNGSENGALVIEGLVRNYGFNPAKIAEKKEDICAILDEMPDEFHADSGGGMSFLNLCMTKDGIQWAEHPTMEALVVLAIAAGVGNYTMPRDMWDVLPGGVPYVTFDTRASISTTTEPPL